MESSIINNDPIVAKYKAAIVDRVHELYGDKTELILGIKARPVNVWKEPVYLTIDTDSLDDEEYSRLSDKDGSTDLNEKM